jgi:hypothetical protein
MSDPSVPPRPRYSGGLEVAVVEAGRYALAAGDVS